MLQRAWEAGAETLHISGIEVTGTKVARFPQRELGEALSAPVFAHTIQA